MNDRTRSSMAADDASIVMCRFSHSFLSHRQSTYKYCVVNVSGADLYSTVKTRDNRLVQLGKPQRGLMSPRIDDDDGDGDNDDDNDSDYSGSDTGNHDDDSNSESSENTE